MSTALRAPMTMADFLDWEERQDLRWEFDGIGPVAMTGGTLNHERIGGTLRALLNARLRGGRCEAFGPTTKIEVAGRIRYPDVFVTCAVMPDDATVASEPVVVFEVLSPSTSRTDRLTKLREYTGTGSIVQYVMLEQDAIAATVLTHRGDFWSTEVLTGDDVLSMPAIGVDLPLRDIYDRTAFTSLEPTE